MQPINKQHGTATVIGIALGAVWLAVSSTALAAQTAPSGNDSLHEIVVTGLRYSIKKSLEIKRKAVGIEEVVSAENVGKMPDKNVADALQRLPGVNTESAASGEGGFDENDRVSIRGTSPSLTQTTINGHSVATGDWFLLDQFQTVGRSVSYTLLPSELVSRVIVHKSQSADMTEGGVAGDVDIETRKPMDFRKSFGLEFSAGGVYADLPGNVDPQLNGMVHWKSGNFGLMVQAFDEQRHVQRNGQEFLGYSTVPAATAAAWQAANPALPNAAGAAFPTLIGSALFTQTRKRVGGDFDFEFRQSDVLTLDLNGFYSHMDADNYNRNFMAWGSNVVSPTYVPTAATVANGTLTSATWPTAAGAPASAVYDEIYRPGASAQTYYLDFDSKYRPTGDWLVTTQVGYTHGVGNTPTEPAYESAGGNGLSYAMNGVSGPATVLFPGLNTASPAQFSTSWAWNDIEQSIDKETYGQIDALLKMHDAPFESVKFGIRASEHERRVNFPEDGGCLSYCFSNVPAWGGATYPSNYSSGLGGGGTFPTDVYQYSGSAIAAYDTLAVSSGPSRLYWPGEFDVKEDDLAAYAMANVGGENWQGNFGVRVVNTYEKSLVNVSGGTNPITTSAFGNFTPTLIDHGYLDFLPSASLKFDLTKELVLRTSAAETMARPDYSALGGAVSLTDLILVGNGGNPNLKPIRSANYDASLEWYYGPESLLSVGVFYMDMSSYVDFGNSTQTYYDMLLGSNQQYTITAPINTTAQDKGVELTWDQPIWGGLGIESNMTYATGETADHTPLVGASTLTYNVSGYFERGGFSTHLAYTYRSHYLVGLDRSSLENEDSIGNLDAALDYQITRRWGVTFDVLNITDATIKYYAANTSQPRAFYSNGRQYYFGVRFKL
ncbi:MAG TPA: TonB-dependent receptor [Steroidobacteraceae bacterium]|nr:TonB-dependent receptor [Steroidobacteraceae bacterium]